MPTEQCVPELELQQFIFGDLDERRFAAVAAHVDSCNPCQDTVVAMSEQSDTLISAIKSAGVAAPAGTEDELKQGLERIFASLRNNPTRTQLKTLPDEQQQIGPYLLQEQLGAGGMGHVYRATHTKLKRDVALKVLSTNRWVNASAVTRFEREMEAIGQLNHPHIVRASDAGEASGMHYLVMEYVDGVDLARLVNRLGALPVADACELAKQCALGLHHAHQNGLVHRDIKPANLMLAADTTIERNGRTSNAEPILKILDLGLALLGDEHLQEGHEITTVGTLMGTLDYMSPEQGIDSHGVDRRTDVYSLGATLFKLLTGRAPYADPQYGTLMRKMTAWATKDAPSIGSVRTDLPTELASVVDRMLSRDPDKRYETADAVVEALEPFVAKADLTKLLGRALATQDPIQNVTPGIPAMALSTRTQSAPRQPATSDRFGRRRNRWLVAIATGFIALAATVIFRMATDFGELVITSDDPNATVLVKRTGQVAQELKLENGKGELRLWTGEYELEVKGDATVQINPKSVKIERSATSAAAIDLANDTKPKLTVESSDAVVLQAPKVNDQPAITDQQALLLAADFKARDAEIEELMAQIKANRATLQKTPSTKKLKEISQLIKKFTDEVKQLDSEVLDADLSSNGLGEEPEQRMQEYTVSVPYTEVVDGKNVTRIRQETRRRLINTTGDWSDAKRKLTRKLTDLSERRAKHKKEISKLFSRSGYNNIDEIDAAIKQRTAKLRAAREKLAATELAFKEKLDVLRNDRLNTTSYSQHIIRPRSSVKIQSFITFNMINDVFSLETSGAVHLGPYHGRVVIVGMKYEEAEMTISNTLIGKHGSSWTGPVMVTDPPRQTNQQ